MEEENTIEYNDHSIQKLKTAKIIKEFNEPIKSMRFSDDGQFLGVCDNSYIWIFDILTTKKIKKLPFKNQKLDHIRFTHNNYAILVASQQNYKIYYWSIHENEIVKIFKGHSSEIQSITMNPKNDLFISTSADGYTKVWDLGAKNTDQPQGILDLSHKKCSNICAEYDITGSIFCIAYSLQKEGNQYVYFRLYDSKKYQEGAFKVWSIESNEVKVLRFSQNGNFMASSTVDGQIFVFDSFDGKLKNKFMNHTNDKYLGLEISFSPDSKYIVSGCEEGCLHIYSVKGNELGNEVVCLNAHNQVVANVMFNHVYGVMVSSCRNLIFWQVDSSAL